MVKSERSVKSPTSRLELKRQAICPMEDSCIEKNGAIVLIANSVCSAFRSRCHILLCPRGVQVFVRSEASRAENIREQEPPGIRREIAFVLGQPNSDRQSGEIRVKPTLPVLRIHQRPIINYFQSSKQLWKGGGQRLRYIKESGDSGLPIMEVITDPILCSPTPMIPKRSLKVIYRLWLEEII